MQVATLPSPNVLNEIYQAPYFSNEKYRDEKILRLENRRRLALVEKYVNAPGAKILDAGCGIGDFVRVAKAQFEMYGFDFSESAIRRARVNNPDIADRIWASRLEDLNLAPSSFDAVCSWDVVEHIWNPIATYTKLVDCLRPNGYLFISSPNIGAFVARVLGKFWVFMTPPEHLSFFSRISLGYLVAKKLNCQMVFWTSRGKWSNLGFVVHKILRSAPGIIPRWAMHFSQRKSFSKIPLYAATRDIQYAVIRKPIA